MPEIELLWFGDCPHDPAARELLHEVPAQRGFNAPVREIDATDPAEAARLRFPGSPTIRINGRDLAPGCVDPGDCTPRRRVHHATAGLRGVPERAWIEAANDEALAGQTR